MANAAKVSVIIPTYNGAGKIERCLKALQGQDVVFDFEVIVVDDGSTDASADIVAGFDGVRLIRQANAGPAAARNKGAVEARGEIIVFTDDDCRPLPNWLATLVKPLMDDSAIVGVKGAYRTEQRSLAARFVQVEYESRYDYMRRHTYIDFIDTYSAAFRRRVFLEAKGYNTSFPVACAEDVELSFRLVRMGHKMVFEPGAIVYHLHPDTFRQYFQKKYKFAYWRMMAVRLNPERAISDSHTPQIMKLQVLMLPALLAAGTIDIVAGPPFGLSMIVIALFLLSTLPFAVKALAKDFPVGLISPLALSGRSIAQFFGVVFGLVNALRLKAAPDFQTDG